LPCKGLRRGGGANAAREARSALAKVLERRAKYDEAEEILKRLLTEREEVYARGNVLERRCMKGEYEERQLDRQKEVLRARHALAELKACNLRQVVDPGIAVVAKHEVGKLHSVVVRGVTGYAAFLNATYVLNSAHTANSFPVFTHGAGHTTRKTFNDHQMVHLFCGNHGHWIVGDTASMVAGTSKGLIASSSRSPSPLGLQWRASNGTAFVLDLAITLDTPTWLTSSGLVETIGKLKEACAEMALMSEEVGELFGEDDPFRLRFLESYANMVSRAQIEGVATATDATRTSLVWDPFVSIAMLRDILERRCRLFGATHEDTLRTMLGLADALLAQDNVDESADLLKQGLTICDDDRRAYSFKGDFAFQLAKLRSAENKLDDAEELYRVALEHKKLQNGRSHPSLVPIEMDLAAVLEKRGSLGEAEKLYSTAVTELLTSRGLRHRDTVLANEMLVGVLRAQGKPYKVEAMRLLELPEGNSLLHPEKSYTRELAEGKLFLDGNHYKTFPTVIEAFTELTLLDLEWNSFTELPETIGQLTNLEELWIRGNRITALPPTINGLTKLKVLHCDGNHLTSLPDEVQMLTALERLDLYGNQLVAAPWLPALVGLTDLNLGANRLATLPDGIVALTNLETLELRGNQLASLPEAIGELSRLQTLSVASNQLRGLPASIGQLSSLRILFVDNNQVLLPDEISALPDYHRDTETWSMVSVEEIPRPQSRVVEEWLSHLKKLGCVSNLRSSLDHPHVIQLADLEVLKRTHVPQVPAFCDPAWIASFQETAECDERTATFYVKGAIQIGSDLQGALAFYFGEGRRAPAPPSFVYEYTEGDEVAL